MFTPQPQKNRHESGGVGRRRLIRTVETTTSKEQIYDLETNSPARKLDRLNDECIVI